MQLNDLITYKTISPSFQILSYRQVSSFLYSIVPKLSSYFQIEYALYKVNSVIKLRRLILNEPMQLVVLGELYNRIRMGKDSHAAEEARLQLQPYNLYGYSPRTTKNTNITAN